MKRRFALAAATLAAIMISSAPVSALTILQSDTFTTSVKSEWVADTNAPDYYKSVDGTLRIGVGKRSTIAGQNTGLNTLRGIKMPVAQKPSSNTWSAIVKINVDNEWISSNTSSRRAEFRVDLVDSTGAPVSVSPTIALEKSGSNWPIVKFYNPRVTPAWCIGDTYIDKDDEQQNVEIEEGWHTLLIKSKDGIITYEIDGKKVGNCTTYTRDVYPSFLAINVLDRHSTQEIEFDNCYLYDGAYTIRVFTQDELDEREEDLASKYEKKRERWYERNSEYLINRGTEDDPNWVWVKGSSLNDEQRDAAKQSRLNTDKEMPDSYWDY